MTLPLPKKPAKKIKVPKSPSLPEEVHKDARPFDPPYLKKLLKATGFALRPLPFIHGVLTLIEISPLFSREVEEFLEEEAGKCSLIFAFKEEDLPDLEIHDKRIQSVLEYLDEVSEQLLQSLNDKTFKPYFGEHPPETPGLDVAKEWCEGFVTALYYKIENWLKENRIDEKAKQAFYEEAAFICYCASPVDAGKHEGKFREIRQAFQDPENIISRSVLDLMHLFSSYESAVNQPPLLPIKSESRPGRNDLCPCNSGKKYKKCCGK